MTTRLIDQLRHARDQAGYHQARQDVLYRVGLEFERAKLQALRNAGGNLDPDIVSQWDRAIEILLTEGKQA